MDVHPVAESLLHGFVVRNVGQHPQFDLAVIRVHQHTARFRHKHFSYFRTHIGTNRDVLQIRLCGGQAPSGCHQILEGGVYTPVTADFFQQTVSVGGFQLGQHPVIHNRRDNRVFVLQLFQNFRIGRVTLLGFPGRRQAQPVEKNFS